MDPEKKKKWIARFNFCGTVMMWLFILSIFSRYAALSGIFWGFWLACSGVTMLLAGRDGMEYDISFIAASVVYALCEALNIVAILNMIPLIKTIADNVGLFCLILLILLMVHKFRARLL